MYQKIADIVVLNSFETQTRQQGNLALCWTMCQLFSLICASLKKRFIKLEPQLQ